MVWTDECLATLPVRGHVRLCGLEMTRLETFCDAAFAFAVTLPVTMPLMAIRQRRAVKRELERRIGQADAPDYAI